MAPVGIGGEKPSDEVEEGVDEERLLLLVRVVARLDTGLSP